MQQVGTNRRASAQSFDAGQLAQVMERLAANFGFATCSKCDCPMNSGAGALNERAFG
jgi:hypothetical protein